MTKISSSSASRSEFSSPTPLFGDSLRFAAYRSVVSRSNFHLGENILIVKSRISLYRISLDRGLFAYILLYFSSGERNVIVKSRISLDRVSLNPGSTVIMSTVN